MDRAGVQRAVVYAQHAVEFDGPQGNELLIEMTAGERRFAPQFAVNPAFDDMEAFAEDVRVHDVRSVRMTPKLHDYPFRYWVVDQWMDWLADEGIPLWLNAWQVDPSEVHETMLENPAVQVVLSEVHYSHTNWALPLLAALPQPERRVLQVRQPVGHRDAVEHRGGKAPHVRVPVPRFAHRAAAIPPAPVRARRIDPSRDLLWQPGTAPEDGVRAWTPPYSIFTFTPGAGATRLPTTT